MNLVYNNPSTSEENAKWEAVLQNVYKRGIIVKKGMF